MTSLLPLSACLTYRLGSPDRSLKAFSGTRTTVRNAEPDSDWQSVQWQISTFSGSTSAS